jgi:hypothetical protein
MDRFIFYFIFGTYLYFSVSKDNKCFLILVQEEPVLNLKRINPLLYEHVEEMMEVYVSFLRL